MSAQDSIMMKKASEVQGLQVGDTVKNFIGLDLNDSIFRLDKALEKGPVVIVFYRGHWCPICNRHLSVLQDSFESIYAKGASVVAISPETAEFLKQTREKSKAQFTLLHDSAYLIAEQFDVAFKPNSASLLMYNTVLNANLKQAHSDNSERLPIPATFIINIEGVIVWRHFDPNYKKRSDVGELIQNIPVGIE